MRDQSGLSRTPGVAAGVDPTLHSRRCATLHERLIYETSRSVIVVAEGCRRELKKLPAPIRADLADALALLDEGLVLSMPLSRPMPSVGAGVHELRFKDRGGAYRVVYALVMSGTIGVLHAFKKTT